MGNKLHSILAIVFAVSIVLLNGCTDANLKKAKRYQGEKDYGQAIHFYKLALDKDPESRSARYGLIESYAQQLIDQPPEQVTPERVEELMVDLRPIAEPLMNDPNIKRYVSLIYQMVAKRYAEEGFDDKAAEAWAEVVKIEPSFAEAQYNLGVALVKVRKYEEALSHFERAVDLNPYFIRGYYAMGNSLLHLNRNEEAIKQYTRALELNPDDPSTHHNLGVAYSRSGNDGKAVEEYEKALEVEPDFALAYQSLAGAYARMGETEKAAEAQKKWNEFVKAFAEAQKGGRK
jgi:tetratricopeptide (TPR) repeat protein